MKIISTILGILCSSAILFAQRTSDTERVFEDESFAVRDTRTSVSVSEAVAVINAIRTGVNTATKGTPAKRVFTEADYQTLTTKADDFMMRRKYDDAILLYKEILKERVDPYANDRILEAEALRAKQQKEDDQRKKDEILRAKAIFASSGYNGGIVHFTGALMADESSVSDWTSKVFNTRDPYSDFLKPGKYNVLADNLPKSGPYTLDGIAVPAYTRLIVYKGRNCTGEVLLDITGPAIVNNGYRSDFEQFKDLNTKQFNKEVEPYFPPAARSWSATNMHGWYDGSMEIRLVSEE